MNHSTYCKIGYFLYSLFVTIFLKMKGIYIKGIIFSCGVTYMSRSNNSLILVGKKCRFMNWTHGNLNGINHGCMISTSNNNAILTIGNQCSFSGVVIRCFKSVTLGNNVRVGANVTIMDGDAHQDDPRSGENKPIKIEDNVWIGANSIVLKGVTIGRNSLIGAGSIVTRDIPANCVAAGNPCKVIKNLDATIIEMVEKGMKKNLI